MIAAVLDQPFRDDIGLTVIRGQRDLTVARQCLALCGVKSGPHAVLGEIRCGGDGDQPGDPSRQALRHQQRQPAPHRGSDEDLGTVGQPCDRRLRILGPVPDRAIGKGTVALPVAGIVEPEEGTAFAMRPVFQINGLGAMHVRFQTA